MSYNPALNGLRAIAILGVLAFHLRIVGFLGGFTGVDVFFVLSGFLIGSNILEGIREGSFSMREFYLRRVERLLPNLVSMILAVLAISYLMLLPSTALKAFKHSLWVLFVLSNFYILRNFGGYWGDSATSTPLLHTWPLAIEEQFYLVLPTVICVLSRYCRRCIFPAIVFAAFASFSLCLYATRTHPEAAFYLFQTRIWELLLGVALAVWRAGGRSLFSRWGKPSVPAHLGRWVADAVGWSGLATILFGYVVISEGSQFPGMIALIPTLGTFGVLIAVADGKSSLTRLLSRPSLELVGKLSYSIYLWHWPLLVVGRNYAELHGRSPRLGALIGEMIGVLLSVVAYYCIEQPFRRRGPGRTRRILILAVGFSSCVICSALLSSRSLPTADSFGLFDTPTFSGSIYSVGKKVALANAALPARYRDVFFPSQQQQMADSWRSGGIVHTNGDPRPRVVVFGSSHALMYARLIDDICKDHRLSVAFLCADATPAFFLATVNESFRSKDVAREFDAARKAWLRKWQPDILVVIDRWDAVIHSSSDFDGQLRAFLAEVEVSARHVVIFTQIPVLAIGDSVNLREFATWRYRRTGKLPRIMPDRNEPLRKQAIQIIEAVARDNPRVLLLRVDTPFYNEDGSIRWSYGRNSLYTNRDHLSDAGAEMVREMCASAIDMASTP
jgi:peptidoglycan/LPS O-acetylase OafA/YrhL